MRRDKLEIPAICIGLALAYQGPNLQPIWVDSFMKSGVLSAEHTGWLASIELLLSAIAAIVLPVREGTYARRMAVAAAVLVAVGNSMAITPVTAILIVGRLLSGIGMGMMLASITRIAIDRPDSQRVLSLAVGAALLLSALFFFLSPYLVGREGTAMLFAITAFIAVMTAIIAGVGLPTVGSSGREVGALGGVRLLPLLACMALASVVVGVNTAATYTITIGNFLGFTSAEIGAAFGVGTLLTLVGPAAAHALGERVGLLKPLYFGLTLVGVSILLLVVAASPVLFSIPIAGLSAAMAFCMPYAITLVSRIDYSGRLASAAQGFAMIGAAAGPALGSGLASRGEFIALALVAVSFVALGLLLFSIAGRAQRAHPSLPTGVSGGG